MIMPGDWTGLGDNYGMRADVPTRVVERITEYIGILAQMFVLAMIVVTGTVILRWLFRLFIL